MYIIREELTETQYLNLLEFAIKYSQSFGITTFKMHKKDLNNSYFDFLKEMSPYEENTYKYILPQHYEKGQKFFIYKISDVGKKYLREQRSFWSWSIPYLPEDLTFYKSKKMWLNCITHERVIFVNCNDNEVLSFLNSIKVNLSII